MCDTDGCSEWPDYIDSFDNVLCADCMQKELDENPELKPEDYDNYTRRTSINNIYHKESWSIDCPYCNESISITYDEICDREVICQCCKTFKLTN